MVIRKVSNKMTKLNPTTMKTQYDGQYDTFCRKNHDYGNSFEESLDKFGIIASLVRMQDKMLRLESLTDDSKTQQVGSESLLDTLEDLSNYAAMTACWLKGVQAEDDVINKSFHAVKDLSAAKDKAREKRGFLMIGHRGSGKGFGTIRELLKELGLSKEAIREIFDEMEESNE